MATLYFFDWYLDACKNPFTVDLPVNLEEFTLRDCKTAIRKSMILREDDVFFFKRMDTEYGFVKKFIDDDDAIIPVIPEPTKSITLWILPKEAKKIVRNEPENSFWKNTMLQISDAIKAELRTHVDERELDVEERKQEISSELFERLEKLEFSKCSETNNMIRSQIQEGLKPLMHELWRLRVRSGVINLGEMAGLILSDGPREKPKSSASSPSPPSSAKTSPLRTTNQMDVCSSKDTKNKRTKLSPWKRPEGEMLKLLTDLRTCRHEIAHEPKRHREDDNPDYFLSNVNHVVEGQEVFKRQKIDGILDDLIKEDVVDHLKKNNPNF